MKDRRKIEGVCGLADMLALMHIPYDSIQAKKISKKKLFH